MAIFTLLKKTDLKAILGYFPGLPDRPFASRGIPLGTVNTYYRIRFRTGQAFYLKIDEVGVESRLQNEIRIFENLERFAPHLSFKVPIPLTAANGRKYIPWGGKFALLLPEIPGRSLYGNELTPARLRQIGGKLAEWHKLPADPRVQEHRFNLTGQKAVWHEIRAALARRHPQLAVFIRRKLQELSSHRPHGEKLTLIHADLFPENILWTGPRLNGILDLDAAGRGAPLFDIGVCLHALCHDGRSFQKAKARAFLEGYLGGKNPTRHFRRFFRYYLDLSALRFLLTRLRDFELKEKGRKVKPFKDYREFERRFRENAALDLF